LANTGVHPTFAARRTGGNFGSSSNLALAISIYAARRVTRPR